MQYVNEATETQKREFDGCRESMLIGFSRYRQVSTSDHLSSNCNVVQMVPGLYSTRLHASALESAMDLYNDRSSGEFRERFARELEDRCLEMWRDGRQQCEAVSLTGRPCLRPLRVAQQTNVKYTGVPTLHFGRAGRLLSRVRIPFPGRRRIRNVCQEQGRPIHLLRRQRWVLRRKGHTVGIPEVVRRRASKKGSRSTGEGPRLQGNPTSPFGRAARHGRPRGWRRKQRCSSTTPLENDCCSAWLVHPVGVGVAGRAEQDTAPCPVRNGDRERQDARTESESSRTANQLP